MLTSLAFFNWAVYGSYMSEITRLIGMLIT